MVGQLAARMAGSETRLFSHGYIAGDYGKPTPALVVQDFFEAHPSLTASNSQFDPAPLCRITVGPANRRSY